MKNPSHARPGQGCGRGGPRSGGRSSTYITLQLLLRGGLAEPSRADHFAAAHRARLSGSGPGSGGAGGRAPDTADACRRRRQAGTSLSRGAAGADGTLRGALALRVRVSPARVRGREQRRVAPSRPPPPGRGRRRAEGAPASSQRARLAATRAVPPAASAALGLSGTVPRHGVEPRSPALRPLGIGPPQSSFRNRHYVARAHTHIHSHSHNAPRGAHSGSPLSASVRPARSSPAPSSGEGGSLPGGAGEAAGTE